MLANRSKLIVGALLVSICSKAQQLPAINELFNQNKNIIYAVPVKQQNQSPFLIVVIPKKIKLFPSKSSNVNLNLPDSIRNNKIFGFPEIRLNHETVINFDSSKAIVFVQGINKKNSFGYEYRIMENNKTNDKWEDFTAFYPAIYKSGFGENDTEMATLGYVGTTWNNFLTVEIRKKNADTIISSATILWLSHSPKVIATFAPSEFNKFLALFKIRSQLERFPMANNSDYDSLLSCRKQFSSNENNIIFYMDDIIEQNLIEYKLDGPYDETPWKLNDVDFNIIWLKNLKPGKYKLLLRYSIQRNNITTYNFEIHPSWQQTIGFKLIAGSLLASFFGFIILIVRSQIQKQKLVREQEAKEKVEMELKIIRSQLNPHFVHNSLNSIQSLLTGNDIPNANKFLLAFSKLMRDTLISGDRQFNSLKFELSILETYLSIEKLRFGFQYIINVSPEVDTQNVEFPSLLLQPLVENAVRHGVGTLKDKGVIEILVSSANNAINVLISDNGKGINQPFKTGYGLKLTNERIALLNRTLHGQSVEMEIQSKENGTTINLIFQNWMS
ncbi:MAG: histidine kinase [Chitinophagaceae bacterium]|nr:histidine kinase [Chitinophagaceae bacterium]